MTGLICIKCGSKLKTQGAKLVCGKKHEFKVIDGFPILQEISSKNKPSQQFYDDTFSEGWYKLDDGSYECLAAIARGNKTIDIACGEGWIEKLAPEIVGVDFSLSALRTARKNGAKNLVCAKAEKLPFEDDSFDVSISAGSLEHFLNPKKALSEMARVSKIQVVTVHRQLSVPFAKQLRKLAVSIRGLKEQAVEEPLSLPELKEMYKAVGLKIIFQGVWTYPIDFKLIFPYVPLWIKIPSCYFIMSIKK